MTFLQLILIFVLFTGCATRGEILRDKFLISPDEKILDVPFIDQADYHCGPASLSMASSSIGKTLSPDTLAPMLYTPKSLGTYQNDLLGASRRLGLLAIPINQIEDVFSEIKNGQPVLIFQNLGLSILPKWHYALVVGYDLLNSEIILHSGNQKYFRLSINTFEKTWKRVDNWGQIIVKPGTIPITASEEKMVAATAALETIKLYTEAQLSYEKILSQWPSSLGALVGLGNRSFHLSRLEEAEKYLSKAVSFHPKASGAWYNYAVVLVARNKKYEAKVAAQNAIKYSNGEQTALFEKNLETIL